MIGAARSRRTTLISLALALAIALSLVLAASGGYQAEAYPTGWTVQTELGPETGTPTSVSIVSAYGYTFATGRGGSNADAIWFQRSLDSGATWETPIYIEDGSYLSDDPVVISGGNMGGDVPYVFVIYGLQRGGSGYYQTWIAKSSDLGATFSQADKWWTTSTSDKMHHRADVYNTTNHVTWVHDEMSGGVWEVKYGGHLEISGAPNTSRSQFLSPLDGIQSCEPDIACEGDYAYVVWNNDAVGGFTRSQIRYQYTDTEGSTWGDNGSSIVGYDASYRHSAPRIHWQDKNPFLYCNLEYMATGDWWTGRYDYSLGSWGPGLPAARETNTLAVRPHPSVSSYDNGVEEVLYCNSDRKLSMAGGPGGPVDDFFGDETIPAGRNAIDVNGMRVAAITSSGKTYFRRQDTVPPTGSITMPAGEGTSDIYRSGNFAVETSAIDDFPAIGTDLKDGTQFYNGVASVTYEYTETGYSWSPLPCAGSGNVAYEPPYRVMAAANDLDQKKIKLRAIAEDSAGNVDAFHLDNWIIVDNQAPDTLINLSGTEGDNGWYTSNVKATLSSSDPNVDFIQYQVIDKDAASGGANWTTYDNPFPVGEGKWDIKARSTDKAGNVGDVNNKSLKSDQTPPVASVLRPDKDYIMTGWYEDENFRLSGTATDENGIAWTGIYVDGDKVYDTTSAFHMSYIWDINPSMEERIHVITVKGKDEAGNVGYLNKNVWIGNCARDFYFAEGNTLPEFDQWILLFNPGDASARVSLNFMLEDGSVIPIDRELAPRQRDTLKVKDVVPLGHHVSTHVRTDGQAIVAECAMYFIYRSGVGPSPATGVPGGYGWDGGHNVMGMNALQTTFYFAEGTTRKNADDGYFEEWVCIQNPSETDTANVVLTYMLSSGQTLEKLYQVAPHSRTTVEVEADVGREQDVSVKVESDLPVAAVRPQYFNYRNYAIGGSAVVGASSAATEWAFAEGATHPGFQEWLTIQNPNNVEAHVTLTYYTGEGQIVTSTLTVGPTTRHTVDVLSEVGQNQDVSTVVTSDVPIICERPAYSIYGLESGKGWTGGESAMGNPGPSTQYFLAEGCTLHDQYVQFDTYYTILNPNVERGCEVVVTYMFQDGSTTEQREWIEPHSRLTIFVNDVVGDGVSVSANICAGLPVSVERPMYFDYNGIKGGHGVVGFGLD